MTGWLLNDWLSHATTAAIALLVGYLIGRWVRVSQAHNPVRVRWTDIARVAFGLLLVALVVATYLQAAGTNDCYRGAFSQVIGALQERSAASGDAAAAQREFLLSVRDDPGTTEAEIDAYIAATDRLEQTRRAAPLPAIPDCGR